MFKEYSLSIVFLLLLSSQILFAQYDAPLYTSYTTNAARAQLYERLIKNTINKNLSISLSDSTEENWQEAFDAMEVLNYKTPFTDKKIYSAFDSLETRSVSFQRSLLELAYTNYAGEFILQIQNLSGKTSEPKIFAMCAEYLIQNKKDYFLKNKISSDLVEKFGDTASENPILKMLKSRLTISKPVHAYSIKEVLNKLLDKNFLPNQVVMYSFQRSNRDYPGMVIIRNGEGNFITDSSGNIFNVPQLARSITNLPFYLTNGNTPQGIFKMYGFDVSMSNFIGPTANVQLGMPIEISIQKFFGDSTITDSVWTMDRYQKLIPEKIKDYFPLYNSYYAGLCGRSEIIAHGTTIDPKFYQGKPYYPLTPTQGCLCTKEIWNGKRLESDQQKLVNGLLKAGGANGYCVVIELDNKLAPVTMQDLLSYLKK